MIWRSKPASSWLPTVASTAIELQLHLLQYEYRFLQTADFICSDIAFSSRLCREHGFIYGCWPVTQQTHCIFFACVFFCVPSTWAAIVNGTFRRHMVVLL